LNFDLTGKRVLLGVTGSISAYKACEIARLFIHAGAGVQVVMTPSAERFVSALTFEALTRNPVLREESESWSTRLNHIEAVKDCDIFVIAPATANTINKLSKGIADNILLQCALACPKPLLVAPAANTQMLANHYTNGSLKMLAINNITIIKPQEKLLACGDTGSGALAEPAEVFAQCVQALLGEKFWQSRRVVVTGGGTREKIDEVRYLSNFSSGKMAESLALALYSRGADVCYITTKKPAVFPQDIYTIEVEDTQEMLEYTVDAVRVAKKGKLSKASLDSAEPVKLIQKTPYLFMAAAVSDYTPAFPQKGKLKKSMLGDSWTLELKKTPDILASLDKNGLITVGFKAEMDEAAGEENAMGLISGKGADAVCYNLLKDSGSFGTADNEIVFLTKEGRIPLGRADKLPLSYRIVDEAKKLDGGENQ